MRFAIAGIAVAVLLALPSGAASKSGSGQLDRLTAQQCAQERLSVGKKAFRKKYGAKHTVRNCISRNHAQVASAAQTAAQNCQGELAAEGVQTFIEDYGEDPTDTLDNAMAECISEEVDTILHPDPQDDGSSDNGPVA